MFILSLVIFKHQRHFVTGFCKRCSCIRSCLQSVIIFLHKFGVIFFPLSQFVISLFLFHLPRHFLSQFVTFFPIRHHLLHVLSFPLLHYTFAPQSCTPPLTPLFSLSPPIITLTSSLSCFERLHLMHSSQPQTCRAFSHPFSHSCTRILMKCRSSVSEMV